MQCKESVDQPEAVDRAMIHRQRRRHIKPPGANAADNRPGIRGQLIRRDQVVHHFHNLHRIQPNAPVRAHVRQLAITNQRKHLPD